MLRASCLTTLSAQRSSTPSPPSLFALGLKTLSVTDLLSFPISSSSSSSSFCSRRPPSTFFTNTSTVKRSFLSPLFVHSLTSNSKPNMLGYGCNKSFTASFSSGGGGSGAASTGSSKEILVQHLLVKEDDLQLLLELQRRVSQGEDLSDLAVEYSICPSKEDGGMLGWVRKGQMVPEFEEAAFSAPVNKVVRCKTKFGWHLLQVLSEREESILEDIHPNEFHVKLQDPTFLEEVQLIDVREPDEVSKASLPGFQVFPLRQFGTWGPEITAKLDPEKDTYVMCHHGMRSLQVAKWLQTQGFKRIFNISGGIHAYAVQVDPSIPTY